MSTTCSAGCLCDCCLGTTQQTPRSVVNPQGLTSLQYRIGTHGDFFSSMLAALGKMQVPVDTSATSSIGMIGGLLRGSVVPGNQDSAFPLARLTARTTDDPSIALLDAWATVLDVLTFYQERIAGEGYLRTASEFRSVLELARLVGYQPRPGVAANSFLAYTVEMGPAVTIKSGSRAQSVPESGQLPQTFETSEDLFAQNRWNALKPRVGQPQMFLPGQTTAGKRVWFNSLSTLLKPNDPLILVFDAAKGEPFRVKKVTTDNTAQSTMAVLQDFTTFQLTDLPSALVKAKKSTQQAISAYRDAVSSDGTASESSEPDSLKTILSTMTTSLISNDASSILAALRTAIAGAKGITFIPSDATSDSSVQLSVLIASLELIESQLSLPLYASVAATQTPPDGQSILKLSHDQQSEYDKLIALWTPQSIATSSPTALVNMLYSTVDFLQTNVSPTVLNADPTKTFTNAVNTSITVLVRTLARNILTRFQRTAQAGVALDTGIAATIDAELQQLNTALQQPTPDVRLLTDFQQTSDSIIKSEPSSLVALMMKELAAQQAALNLSNVSSIAAQVKKKLDAFNDRCKKLETRLASYAAIPRALDKAHLLAALATAQKAILQDPGSTAEAAFLQLFADQVTSASESECASVSIAMFGVWEQLLLPDVTSYVKNLARIQNESAIQDLQTKAADTAVTFATLSAALAAVQQLSLDGDRPDVTNERFGLFTAFQSDFVQSMASSIDSVVQQLQTPSGDAVSLVLQLRVLLQQIVVAEQSVRSWLTTVSSALQEFTATDEGIADLEERLRSSELRLSLPTGAQQRGSTDCTAIVKIVEAAKAAAAAQDPSVSLRDSVNVLGRLIQRVLTDYWNSSGVPAALLARFAIGSTQFRDKIPQLDSDPDFLQRLGDGLKVLRQQQRLASNAAYPRITPWLNEFAEALNQLISDLEIKALAQVSEAAHTESAGFPDLKFLKREPNEQPPSAARLTRRLGIQNDANQEAGGAIQLADLVPQIALSFDRRLDGALYEAIRNGQVLRGRRFQGIHALRARSAPFGHNVPMRIKLGNNGVPVISGGFPDDPVDWGLAGLDQKNVLKLDAVFDKVTPGSFVVIDRAKLLPNFDLDNPMVARVEAVATVSSTDYGQPGTTITQLTLDRPWISNNDRTLADIRDVTVYLQSEPLDLAGEPIDADIGTVQEIVDGVPTIDLGDGSKIDLDEVYDGLPTGRWLIVAGERTDIPNTSGVKAAELVMLAGATQVADAVGTSGQGYPHTVISLAVPLAYSYQRGTVTIYGNVVKADQGETKSEILGAGKAAVAGQKFDLKQQPLTYLAAPNPSGAIDTLQVRVNGVLWHSAPSLFDLEPDQRGYVLRTDDAGKTTVLFGDGEHGARLPTGVDNVRAAYRVGLGAAGNVAAGKITNLISRPLGVNDVTNPLPAVGGVDRETTDQARRNAPVGISALDRLVSTVDYEDFARAYAGIEKAYAANLSDGLVQRLHLTVAGRDGDEISTVSDLYRNLVQALRKAGDPSLPITIDSRRLRLIVIVARLRVLPDFEFDTVVQAVRDQLYAAFGFDRREFGQDVILSDVTATIQNVPGVAAVAIDRFGPIDERGSDGEFTPISDLVSNLQNIPEFGTAQFKSRIPVLYSHVGGDGIIPAQIALLSARVPDTLILNEWKS